MHNPETREAYLRKADQSAMEARQFREAARDYAGNGRLDAAEYAAKLAVVAQRDAEHYRAQAALLPRE